MTSNAFGGTDLKPCSIYLSAIAKNFMLHENFAALSSIEPELLPIEVLHCKNKEFCLSRCCDLYLDPMTFIYELDSYSLNTLAQTKSELSTSRLSYYRMTYMYTDRQTGATENITTPFSEWWP